uniref:Recep_L_domain domain-containing protein n=1 Tax=Elaeophora elaphi TaxID=1147741 RepID=A0A0R3RM53_9BILA
MYFRDCLIRHIEYGAFGSMRRIQHFFARGNITVELAGSAIFRNSTISDVIFEDAHFIAPSDCFVGLKATSIQLINSIWNMSKKFNEFRNFHQKIGRFMISNSTVDLLAMKAFQNTRILSISYSTLKKLATMKFIEKNSCKEMEWIAETEKTIESVTQKLEILETTINRITAKAFVNLSKFKNVKISRCRIDVIEKNAFQGFRSNEIRIDRTQIDKLSIASFAALSMNLFSWQACNLSLIESMTFQGAKVQTLRFSRCHIKNIMKRSFAELEANNLILAKTKIYRCEERAFAAAKVKKFTITRTEIVSSTFDSVFRDFRPIYFHARNNLFDCTVRQCDTNSLLLDEHISMNLPWYFQSNQCSKQEICHQPPEWTSDDLFCRFYYFLAKCFCTNSKVANVPDVNSSVVIIGDCEALEIDLAENDKISSLHVFRTDALRITKIPASLQIFEIFHTKIVRIGSEAFLGLKMERIELISTQIELLESRSFVNFQLSSFILRHSIISYVEFHAFSNSSVRMLYAEQSNFLHVFDFWRYLNDTTLVEVFVNLPRYLLEGAQNFCLKEVVVACECLSKQLANRNNCGKIAPICSSTNYVINCSIEEEIISRSFLKQSRILLILLLCSLNLFFRLNLYQI